MELLKLIVHPNAFPLLLIILMLCFVTLSFYGLWLCCRSRNTTLNIVEDGTSVYNQDYTWKNLLSKLSFKDTVAIFDDQQGNYQNFGGCALPSQSSGGFSKLKNANVLHNSCGKEKPSQTSNIFKNIQINSIKDKILKFQWVNQWFYGEKENHHNTIVSEDSEDLEEPSLDFLISRLDSLVLKFHSSDASPSIGSEPGSITDDDITAISALNVCSIDILESSISEHKSEYNSLLSYPLVASHVHK